MLCETSSWRGRRESGHPRCGRARDQGPHFLSLLRHLPGSHLQDIEEWAVPNNADYIALSFVQIHGTNHFRSPRVSYVVKQWRMLLAARSADDVKDCRKHFGGKDIKARIVDRTAAFVIYLSLSFMIILVSFESRMQSNRLLQASRKLSES